MAEPNRAIVFYSGGLMSWAAAKRTVEKYGAKNVTLLFTDTLIEDPDLYRFLDESTAELGAQLVALADGRTPWEVFRDKKFIGNTLREAPLCERPWMSQRDIHAWARDCGLTIPRLYRLGFAHNNCGGFCIKAGEGHFLRLLKTLPQVYAYHEDQEAAFNAARPGKPRQTVLAPERWIDGKRRRVPMSLREFRERAGTDPQIDMFDVGGCGCFVDEVSP